MTIAAKVKAPTPETSELPCTHVRCGYCDSEYEWAADMKPGEWTCSHCTRLFDYPGEPVWEHHSLTALGYRDDKAHWWPPLRVDPKELDPDEEMSGMFLAHGLKARLLPMVDLPSRWIYYAKAPA